MSEGLNVGSQMLSPQERARLANILSRLASPFEGERAAAGLLATAFVTKHNLAWSDLVETALVERGRPTHGAPTMRADPQPQGDARPNAAPQPKGHSQPKGDPQPKGDRRRGGGGRPWRGYNRRRSMGRGGALDLSA